MKRIRYGQYVPDPAEEIDLGDLLEQLRDFFLESGFYSRFGHPRTADQGLEQLRRALARILKEHPQVPQNLQREFQQFDENGPEQELSPEARELIDRLIERLLEEGYLRMEQSQSRASQEVGEGEVGDPDPHVQFELTDKSVDFLGYRTLRHLLGALGRGSFGRHRTEQLSTGVEAEAASKPFEFGDLLNLDISSTLLQSVKRAGLRFPLDLDYGDLRVHQTEHHSSCATVLMLDCSHSMILYGEDRFTPAKQVALALAHLSRTQYPGDSLELVLFHDSAEQVPLVKLAAVKVGPYHTNTREGLRLARNLLRNQRKEMRQIIMITDGKPSAITLPDGRIYKNPFGLDPMILDETFREVSNCRRAGILINTFMVASDYHLVEFVKRVSRICRGKAYFTSTVNLARYILMDFMSGKSRTVH